MAAGDPHILVGRTGRYGSVTYSRESASSNPTGPAGGDLSGEYPNPSVSSILGVPVDDTDKADGKVLLYDASGGVLKYGDVGGSPSGPAGGDLAGTYPDPSVAGIRGVDVDTASPTDGDALIYSSTAGKYIPAPPTSSGILPTPSRVGQSVWWDGLVWRAGDSLVTPGTTHADDDEFEGSSLDSSWTRRVVNYAGPGIDPERSDTSDAWWDDHNNVRKSWYFIQDGVAEPPGLISKPHEFAENEAVYVRFRADKRPGTATAIDGQMAVLFTSEDFLDRMNFVLFEALATGLGGQARAYETRSGGSAAASVSVPYRPEAEHEYAYIQKTGSTFVLWLSPNGNHWTRMLSFTPNGDVGLYTHFGFSFNSASATPVNLIGGLDFVRFRPGITQGVP